MNAAEKLSRETARIAALKSRFDVIAAADAINELNTIAQRTYLQALLERAHTAAGNGDALEIIGVVHEMEHVR